MIFFSFFLPIFKNEIICSICQILFPLPRFSRWFSLVPVPSFSVSLYSLPSTFAIRVIQHLLQFILTILHFLFTQPGKMTRVAVTSALINSGLRKVDPETALQPAFITAHHLFRMKWLWHCPLIIRIRWWIIETMWCGKHFDWLSIACLLCWACSCALACVRVCVRVCFFTCMCVRLAMYACVRFFVRALCMYVRACSCICMSFLSLILGSDTQHQLRKTPLHNLDICPPF